MSLELLFMTFTAEGICRHHKLLMILSMTSVTADNFFPFGWRPVFTLSPLSHNARIFRHMAGNALLIGKFTVYSTAGMKIFWIKVIRRVVPSDYRQKAIELPELSFSGKEFLWTGIITCKPTR